MKYQPNPTASVTDTNDWTHPKTGEIRRYINPDAVFNLMPREDTIGYTYSGADMDRILCAKYWIDANGHLHIDNLSERGRIRESDIRAMIEAALAEASAASQTADEPDTTPAETDTDEVSTVTPDQIINAAEAFVDKRFAEVLETIQQPHLTVATFRAARMQYAASVGGSVSLSHPREYIIFNTILDWEMALDVEGTLDRSVSSLQQRLAPAPTINLDICTCPNKAHSGWNASCPANAR